MTGQQWEKIMAAKTKSIVVPDAPTELKLEPLPLRTADRCDYDCPAQAMVRVVKDNELILDFCGHHFSSHEPKLLGEGFAVVEDVRFTLVAKETADHA